MNTKFMFIYCGGQTELEFEVSLFVCVIVCVRACVCVSTICAHRFILCIIHTCMKIEISYKWL